MTNSTATLEQLTLWLSNFEALVKENRAHLTELDSAIGDADHGANMDRGMTAVMEKIGASTPAGAVDDLFKTVGMTLVTSVGGASGPLYGTFFLRFGVAAGAQATLDGPTFSAALRAGLDGVVARGKAEIGDKTMFDALSPAVNAFASAVAEGPDIGVAANAAFNAAKTGRDSTEPLVARKGRASYLGERSADHLDPGATSTALLFGALASALTTR